MIRELDLQTLWRELDEYNKELEKETQSLKEVWVKIAQLKEEAEKDATAYVMMITTNICCFLSISNLFMPCPFLLYCL